MWKDCDNLENKGNFWKSYDPWKLVSDDNETYYIENTSSKRILGVKDTDDMVISLSNKNDSRKLWHKEELVNVTYKCHGRTSNFFKLVHPHSNEVLTATIDNKLIVSKGIFEILRIDLTYCILND